MNRLHRNQVRHVLVVLLCLGLVGVLVGCGGDGTDGGSGWTVREGALTLERDLFVGNDEAFYFGTIADVGVDSDGRIYVADGEAQHIKVIAPDGVPVDTIGQRGKGPGEFQHPRDVTIGLRDSLYVYDLSARQLSVFAPGGDFIRRRSVVPGTRTTILGAGEGGHVVLSYETLPFLLMTEKHRFLVKRIPASRGEEDTLLTARPQKWYTPGQQEKMHYPVPYSPQPHAVMGPTGDIHIARSDSLTVTRYDSDGRRLGVVTIPFEPVPVTDEDRRRIQDSLSDRPIAESKIPTAKPAFEQFLVDDEGRYWFGRPTADPDTTDWWVADPAAKRVGTARLSDDVDILTIRNGKAYGRAENGVHALVRYRVRVGQ